MNDHIAKPIDPDQLFGVLLRWIRRAEGDVKGPDDAAPAHHAGRRSQDEHDRACHSRDRRARRAEAHRRQSASAMKLLLRKFAEQQSEHGRRPYEAALSAGDAATAERAAHSLKGAAGTLGAHALAEAAAKAETRGQERAWH